ncbi:MAG: transposase, partial [Albidovulum sp.]|nr:transposase [Albidovulum sp.]
LPDGPVPKVLSELDAGVREFDRRIEDLVAGSDNFEESDKDLTSVPGIGPVTAASLIAWMGEFGAIGNRQAAALIGVAPFARDSGTLKGGRHVAIGRAPARDVDVFFFRRGAKQSGCQASFRSSRRDKSTAPLHRQRLKNTMIYVTRDQCEALTLADRIAILRDGKIQQLGVLPEIYNRPQTEYAAEFIGSPTINLFSGPAESGVFKSNGLEIKLDGYQWSGEAANGEA